MEFLFKDVFTYINDTFFHPQYYKDLHFAKKCKNCVTYFYQPAGFTFPFKKED